LEICAVKLQTESFN